MPGGNFGIGLKQITVSEMDNVDPELSIRLTVVNYTWCQEAEECDGQFKIISVKRFKIEREKTKR